jgi:hypothetical protein
MKAARRLLKILPTAVLVLLIVGAAVFAVKKSASGLADLALIQQEANTAKALVITCRTFAADSDGKFPQSLDELYPGYMDVKWLLYDENQKPKWSYRSGVTPDSDPSAILIHSVEPVRSKWIRAHVGGRVTISDQLDDPEGKVMHKR